MFNYNEVIEYKGAQYIVVAQSKWQSRHYKPDCWSISWQLSPIQYDGFEHDEEIWVSQADLIAYCKEQNDV